jgi:hypothetical protein
VAAYFNLITKSKSGMVEVFKTNIKSRVRSKQLIKILEECFPGSCVNFDLEDRDNILRVEGEGICPIKVKDTLTAEGYLCEVLV